jgi:SAM-dependent methyltransferase
MNSEQNAQMPPGELASAFSLAIYRRYNPDLQYMNDEQLAEHFRICRHEPRVYAATSSTAEAVSMRWLRGAGMEIGAGPSPVPLYGNATTQKADSGDAVADRENTVDIIWNIDEADFANDNRARFDFAIASHVLEHTDSFLRALEHMMTVVRPGGIVYIVLPDIAHLSDIEWMQNFDFQHHVDEYRDPLVYVDIHDRIYIEGHLMQRPDKPFPAIYDEIVAARKLPPRMRFLHHKHNYSFNDWLALFVKAQDFFAGRFRFMDVRYGYDRADCHFVLQVT